MESENRIVRIRICIWQLNIIGNDIGHAGVVGDSSGVFAIVFLFLILFFWLSCPLACVI